MGIFTIKGKKVEFQEEDTILSYLQRETGNEYLKLERIVDFINENDYTTYYIDEKLHIYPEEQPNCTYLWLRTGEYDINDKPLFVSLLHKGDGFYSGLYVGTPDYLMSSAARFLKAQKSDEKAALTKFYTKLEKHLSEKADKQEDMLESSDSRPMDFERLTSTIAARIKDNPWSTDLGLDRYLKMLGRRAGELLEKNENGFFILNASKSLIINIGLKDEYGMDILVLYKWHEKDQSYFPDQIIESKSDIMNARFTREQALQIIKPIRFFSKEDVALPETLSMDDMDITHFALNHIIEERRQRIPEDLHNLSKEELATRIRTCIEVGVRQQHAYGEFIKPNYSASTRNISWLIPANLHDPEKFAEPEVAILFSKSEYFYKVRTILVYDDQLQDRIITMSVGLRFEG